MPLDVANAAAQTEAAPFISQITDAIFSRNDCFYGRQMQITKPCPQLKSWLLLSQRSSLSDFNDLAGKPQTHIDIEDPASHDHWLGTLVFSFPGLDPTEITELGYWESGTSTNVYYAFYRKVTPSALCTGLAKPATKLLWRNRFRAQFDPIEERIAHFLSNKCRDIFSPPNSQGGHGARIEQTCQPIFDGAH